jgi:hypothetical protein
MVFNRLAIYHPFGFLAIAIFYCAFLLFGCATNPATKKMELMLVSEDKEFEIGQAVDKKVREQMGVYLEQPVLREYVKENGRIYRPAK